MTSMIDFDKADKLDQSIVDARASHYKLAIGRDFSIQGDSLQVNLIKLQKIHRIFQRAEKYFAQKIVEASDCYVCTVAKQYWSVPTTHIYLPIIGSFKSPSKSFKPGDVIWSKNYQHKKTDFVNLKVSDGSIMFALPENQYVGLNMAWQRAEMGGNML